MIGNNQGIQDILAAMAGGGGAPPMGGGTPGGMPSMAPPSPVGGGGLPFPRPGMVGAQPSPQMNIQALLGALGSGGGPGAMGGVGMGRLPIPPKPNNSPVHEIVRQHFASRPLMGGRPTTMSGGPPRGGPPLARPSPTSGY